MRPRRHVRQGNRVEALAQHLDPIALVDLVTRERSEGHERRGRKRGFQDRNSSSMRVIKNRTESRP